MRLPSHVSRCALSTAALCAVVTLIALGCVSSSEGGGVSRSAAAHEGRAGAPRHEALTYALPKDAMGNLDWHAAVRDGVLDPLAAIDPGASGMPPLPLDVPLGRHMPGLEVVFSHETHTYWLSCDSCHSDIFAMQAGADRMTMEKIFRGEYCGRCHGTVAFAADAGCSRCHKRVAVNAVPPAGKATDEVLGDIVMDRHSSASYQPAVIFRHRTHRMYFRCSACHTDVFDMRAGANEITMDALLAGKSCGRCHDGLRAFGVGLETCSDCHSREARHAG
jgi:c(7)-type cytochrome triheme protein